MGEKQRSHYDHFLTQTTVQCVEGTVVISQTVHTYCDVHARVVTHTAITYSLAEAHLSNTYHLDLHDVRS